MTINAAMNIIPALNKNTPSLLRAAREIETQPSVKGRHQSIAPLSEDHSQAPITHTMGTQQTSFAVSTGCMPILRYASATWCAPPYHRRAFVAVLIESVVPTPDRCRG